jgi:nicotinamide-nucleotide amidase
MLGDDRLDRNSLTITRTLLRYGFEVVEKRVVGDTVEAVAGAIRDLLAGVDVLVVTGGLGPTADDVTREGVARALERRLVPNAETLDWVSSRYAAIGRSMPPVSEKMAMVVDGSRPIRNPRGAAPGLVITVRGRLLVALPGVPWEMEAMLEDEVEAELSVLGDGIGRIGRTILVSGVFESDVEERIEALYDRFGRNNITILAKCGIVRLVLTAVGDPSSATRRLNEMEAAFCAELGDDVAGVGVAGLEEVVLGRLAAGPETLAAAESCTGGLLSARLTDIAGASEVFLGGVVSYSNEAKERMIDVPNALLEAHGAVSEPVARAMAEGVRGRFEASWGVGITGIAGPSGGTDEKPVGLVHWAVAGPDTTVAAHRVFPGDRAAVRLWSVHAVLDTLRRAMTGAATA